MSADEEAVRRLLDNLERKLESRPGALSLTKGAILIRAFPNGKGYDIDVTTTF